MLRVLLVDDTGKDVSLLHDALAAAGHEIVGKVETALDLIALMERTSPDIIIVDTESPSRDVLEQIALVSRNTPRPIVMFTEDGDQQQIERAFSSGVTTYIVEGLQPARVRSILDVARARFAAEQALREELEKAKGELAARKVIEKAKGILQESRQVSEQEAFSLMRKMAMDKQVSLIEISEQIIAARNLLG
jgi:response regulator NasT